MIVVMKEHYQDAKLHLYPEKQYEVDAVLGEWLIKHRKAVKIETPKYLEVEPQFEQPEPPQPQPQEFRNRRSGRRAQQ